MDIKEFQKVMWEFYKENKRDLPWRNTTDPYKILVSEVMLQQTQVSRVLQKYPEFIKSFPDFPTLSQASTADVLKVWQGLGYNRRALYLREIAIRVVRDFGGNLPSDPDVLIGFSGIGRNTACSTVVFSANKPLVFIETNIRRVFIHHFFSSSSERSESRSPSSSSRAKNALALSLRMGGDLNKEIASSPPSAFRGPRNDGSRLSADAVARTISDKELTPLIEQALDQKNPREWYYALMDYGTYLAKHPPAGGENPNRKSKHYVKQSKFEGSVRQVRGLILKKLLEKNGLSKKKFQEIIGVESDRFETVLNQLQKEGFVIVQNDRVSLANS